MKLQEYIPSPEIGIGFVYRLKEILLPLSEICRLANELKIIVEDKSDFEWAEKYRALVSPECRLYLQPEWSMFEKIIPEIVDYVKRNSNWKISLQVHKFMHIP